jgi:hypothetical protein
LARHPNANSLIRDLPKKIEHVIIKTQKKKGRNVAQSVKPGEVLELVGQFALLFTGRSSVEIFSVFL